MNFLGNFPVDILSLIVNNVDNKDLYMCTLVNKQFYAAANPLLWRSPNVRNSASLFKVTTGIFLAQHPVGQHIRKLDLGMGLDNTTLLLLLKHANFLEELKVRHGEFITDEGFCNIPQHCQHLKTLYLNDVFITDKSIQLLGQHCHQLFELTLSNCLNLSHNSFLSLVNCPLKTLTLIFPPHCQDTTIASEMVKGLARMNLLTSLSIILGSALFIQCLLMMNTTTGPTPWPQLTYLHLEKCGNFEDQHISPFIQLHPKLSQVYLCESSISDTTLDIISSFLPHATEIGINFSPQITTGAIRRLIWNQPLLSFIACRGCEKTLADFPEAGDEQSDNNGGILCLGMDTINKIRHGSDPCESSGDSDNIGN